MSTDPTRPDGLPVASGAPVVPTVQALEPMVLDGATDTTDSDSTPITPPWATTAHRLEVAQHKLLMAELRLDAVPTFRAEEEARHAAVVAELDAAEERARVERDERVVGLATIEEEFEAEAAADRRAALAAELAQLDEADQARRADAARRKSLRAELAAVDAEQPTTTTDPTVTKER